MDARVKRLIDENPNLSSAALSRLTGITNSRVNKYRKRPLWKYNGFGVPFMCFVNSKERAAYEVTRCGNRLFKGSFHGALEVVDRLIYCLESNNGKLPSKLLDNMKFTERG